MTDEATNDDITAAALDASVPDAGQDPALDPAAIDASTVAPQPLAFIAPDNGTQSSLGAPGSGQIVRVSTNTVQLGRFPECRAALIKPFPYHRRTPNGAN